MARGERRLLHTKKLLKLLAIAPGLEDIRWKVRPTTDFPQQTNNYDCGLFICAAALCISTNKDMIFSQTHMANFRLKIADRLLRDSTCRNHGTALKNPLAERPTPPTTDEASETKDTTPSTPSTQIKIPTSFQIGYKPKASVQTQKTKKTRKTNKQTTKTPTSKNRNRDKPTKTTTQEEDQVASIHIEDKQIGEKEGKPEAPKKRKTPYATEEDNTKEIRNTQPKIKKQRQGSKTQDAPT